MNLEKSITTPLLQGVGVLGYQELVVLVMIIGLNVVWVWSLVHCVKNPRLSDNIRIIGVVLIAVLWLLGSLIYLFLPRKSSDQL